MRRHENILHRFAKHSDMPTEVYPKLPLVELAGDKRVLIENHRGVKAYGDSCIRVCTSYGQLCISGSAMELVQMTRQQLVISGRIDSIVLTRGET